MEVLETQLFDYDLPPDLIAQHPAERRDASRLLVVSREDDQLVDAHFTDLPRWLRPGDCLVVNDTRVLPARFYGHRGTGGRIEGLFLDADADGAWHVLLKPSGRLKVGEWITLDGVPSVEAELLARNQHGRWEIRLADDAPTAELLSRIGHAPLPPYIRRDGPEDSADSRDRRRYQTVYAADDGAVAAPTAGMHFTDELLGQIKAAGVYIATVTLHVGVGTFRPISTDAIEDHAMHREFIRVSQATVDAIRTARAGGGRCIAVGTTSVRSLETAAAAGGAYEGWTDLYIRPGHGFGWIDGLITNFHLPKSSLLVLISALAGLDRIRRAYEHAIEHRYRFYSYGDAMLIL